MLAVSDVEVDGPSSVGNGDEFHCVAGGVEKVEAPAAIVSVDFAGSTQAKLLRNT